MAYWYFENAQPWDRTCKHRPRRELEAQLLSEGHTLRWWNQGGLGMGEPTLESTPDVILVWAESCDNENYWTHLDNVLGVITLPEAWEE